MQLIGMLDSPYVRRTAIAMRMLGVDFEHRAVSVFSTFEQFHQINPVVKAPSLVCDDGEVLMDSTLIIDCAETIAAPRSLLPSDLHRRRHALRIIGLALAACEKNVQIIYERNWRPEEKQYQPWLDRVQGQLLAAYAALETGLQHEPLAAGKDITLAGITTAVAWQFTQSMLSDLVLESRHPAIQAYSARAEQLPEFLAFPPIGPGVPKPA